MSTNQCNKTGVADLYHYNADPYPTFYFHSDPHPAFFFFLLKCGSGSSPSSKWLESATSVYRPSKDPFEASKSFECWLQCGPEPTFHSNADPNPASNNGWDLAEWLERLSQCWSRNCPGFDPSILRHSGIWGAADETVLNTVHIRTKNPEEKK